VFRLNAESNVGEYARMLRHRLTMRVPPPRPAGDPEYTAAGQEPSPLCAARLLGRPGWRWRRVGTL